MCSHTALSKPGHYWIAVASAVWASIFALFHIIWASGWYVGLDAVEASGAFAKPWFLVYDLLVAGMCIIAVPVSLALATLGGHRPPLRLVVALAWIGTTLLVLRAVASLAQGAYDLATGRFSLRRIGIWEPWFYLGAILFTFNLWFYRRRIRSGAA